MSHILIKGKSKCKKPEVVCKLMDSIWVIVVSWDWMLFSCAVSFKKVKLQVSLMSVVCLDALLQTSLCVLGWKQVLSATGYERTDCLPWCHGHDTHTSERLADEVFSSGIK